MYNYKQILAILAVATCLTRSLFADSVTINETWVDSVDKNGGITSKDVGTLNASFTVPELASITANDWSNMVISVSMTPYDGSEFISDVMADAPNAGGKITATSASFVYQGFDTNGNFVNIEKITFTRSGSTLTIADQLLNPPSWQPPSSLLAGYYLSTDGSIQDVQDYDVNLQDSLDDGDLLNVDLNNLLSVTGANNTSMDSFGDVLNNVQVSAAATLSAPTVTPVSPTGSSTTTTGLLSVQVKAAGSLGIANVEFNWNGSDVGSGSSTSSGVWSQLFALAPGANTFQTVATDTANNNSSPSSVTVTYVNSVTNAPAIQVSERELDSTQADGSGGTDFAFTQNVGILNAAIAVPGLQAMSFNTWTNLHLSFSLGNLTFSNTLAKAAVLTSTSATFNVLDSGLVVEQLIISRLGNTLVIFKRTGNPSYANDNTSIIASDYYGTAGAINDQKIFSLMLVDGTTQSSYANVSQIVYLTGSNTVTHDSDNTPLNNVQVSGAADFTRPTVTITAPVANQLWSNSVFTVTGKSSDNVLVTNVFYSINNSGWVQATPSNTFWTNWSAQVNLIPGTNTVAAYSIDSNGNFSLTNSVKFIYVLSAPLTVTVTGSGTVSPNYNGVLLPLGRNFSMTATGTGGFGFVSWTGSLTTNSPTLLFNMASNLVFTANFVDIAKPTNQITAPTAGLHVSNELFVVTGKAADNVGVTNVFYSLNGGDWTPATTANNWSNWTAQVDLTPGTNTIAAYAVDGTGNVSVTNSVKFVYVLSAVLTVNVGTGGTVVTNYNGALLQIGQTYSMTAKTNVGFAFGGWSGSITTNSPTLRFVMASNLVFTASFVDAARPTNQITAPTSGLHVSNNVFIVTGKAGDNVGVTNVFYSLNSGDWTNATTANNWSNWTAQVTLTPGTNTIAAYAVDAVGNVSTTNTVTFVYVLSAVLTVNVGPGGTVVTNFNGALLQIGQTYSMTATPSTGFAFGGWTGSITTNSPTLRFTMASNLVFNATFIDAGRPTNQITAPTVGLHVSNAVFVVTGKAGDNLGVANVFYSLNSGDWTAADTANNFSNWTAQVTLTPGTNTIAAYAVDGVGNVSTTNTVSFVYVLSATLTVNVGTGGTVVTNYNGALLQIGQPYSMTAKTNVGFAFGGWSGSITTNSPTLRFVMASNLVFTASFIDVARPTNQITAPTAGLHVSNDVFVVTGKAGDNVGVTNVFYSLNSGDWTNATTANNWSNWTAQVTLTPGTNTIAGYAVDGAGNVSTTNTVTFVYVLSAVLTVNVGPGGTVITNYNGALLQIGQTYSMTATPSTGFAFGGWSGSITTNSPTLRFVMSSNLVFTASFVDSGRPTNQITAPTSGLHVSNDVFVVTGKAGDNLGVANVFYSLNSGDWTAADTANNFSNWTAQVTLTPGTNTIAAYAVDGAGNVSTTNTVSFVYVLSAVLTVNVGPGGTVVTNYNGALLQIGQTYSMTATPSTGFAFGGWSGSITTNSPTLRFIMASNLEFTASFIDVARPTNQISAPTSGLHVSNDVFVVTGKAGDNLGVASVFYSLNSGEWIAADTANNFSNWTAQVTLTPGTNTIAAYAVDGAGNVSTTNTVSFVYVLSAVLTVNVGPGGTVVTNYNGALLQLGQTYSMTATPSAGFAFGGWSGSITTNSPALRFVMASNLEFTVSFIDVAKPTNQITAPTAGLHVSNDVFVVTGKAGDNLGVTNVFYSLNGGDWTNATTANNWSNWTAQVILTPGANTIAAYAVDAAGNVSATNTVGFVYVLSDVLTVNVGPGGTVVTNYNGALLQIGQPYSMTAKTNAGFAFAGWSGSISTNSPTLKFVMASNLVFTASFTDIAKPTLTISSPTNNQKVASGVVNLVGKASDNGTIAGVWYQLNGGTWTVAPTTNNWTNFSQTLPLIVGTNMVKAYALDLGGNYSLTNSVSFVSSNAFKLQLAFDIANPISSNGLAFSLLLSSNLTGHIQYSTNFVNWINLTNFNGTNSTLNFVDPGATNSALRFYRAVAP